MSATSVSRPSTSSRRPSSDSPGGATLPRGFFRTLWRALRQLFHESTGAMFAILAVAAVSSALRAWQNGTAKWIVALPLLYAMMMAYFSVTSFLSARRVP